MKGRVLARKEEGKGGGILLRYVLYMYAYGILKPLEVI
jgi:hypothetical protein